MKRDQAELIAKEKAKVMYEYLEKFMEDEDTITGEMTFSSDNNRLAVDIFIYHKGKLAFDRHFDMGISYVYADLLTRELSGLLLEGFMPSENFGVSDYAYIKGHPTMSRDGIYVFNGHNSRVNVNFRVKNDEFADIMREHNKQIDEFRNKQLGR